MIGPKRIVSIQFNFYSTHTKYALNKLNTNTYVEEKNNYNDLEGKKEKRERFAEYNGGAAGGVKEGVKKLCLAVLCYGQQKNPRLRQTIPSL